MGIKEMQGVSAYLEYVGPRGRKRKKNCVYYNEQICHCKNSNYYLLNCGGRYSCMNYDDSEETAVIYEKSREEFKLKTRQAKLREDRKLEVNATTVRVVKKIKIEVIQTKKMFLVQLVDKSKANPKACMFDRNSKTGKRLSKCKAGDIVDITMGDGKTYKVKVININ